MRRVSVALVLSALIISSCGSSSTSDQGISGATSPTDSATTNTSDTNSTDSNPNNTEVATDEIFSSLASEPTFVHPFVDPVRTVAIDIQAAVGGEVVLPLSPDINATLSLPPGALKSDQTIELSAVTSLESGDEGFLGVDIQPSGLIFDFATMPTLTFTGIDSSLSVVGWDDDNVASVLAGLPQSDTSIAVKLAHFSGAGVGTVSNVAVDPQRAALEKELRVDLQAEQYRQLTGTDTGADSETFNQKYQQKFNDLEESYIQPMLKAAANGPCGFQSHDAIAKALGFWQLGNLIGVNVDLEESLVAKVIQHDLDCAKKSCDLGDPAAGGKYLRATQEAQLLGVDDRVSIYSLEEFSDIFQKCTLRRVTVMGRSTLNMPTGDISEGFVAKGVVNTELVEVKNGNNLLPMTVTVGGVEAWDSQVMSAVASGFAALMGMGGVSVNCTSTPIGPSVAEVHVALRESTDNPKIIEPMVTFKPFINPGSRNCQGLTFPESTWVLFASHVAFNKFVFSGADIRHEFTQGEVDSSQVYRTKETISLSAFLPSPLKGSATLLMNVQPVAELQAPSGIGLNTNGLVDKYAEIASS